MLEAEGGNDSQARLEVSAGLECRVRLGWTISGPRLLESVDRSNTNHLPNRSLEREDTFEHDHTQTEDQVLGRKRERESE